MTVNALLLGQFQLLPNLSISAGTLSEAVPALSPSEQASIAPMAPARLAEFAQGRMHARIALAQLGAVNASIPIGSDRAPVWPLGFVGSISHVPQDHETDQPGRVIAVVARVKDCSGLGVDLERTGRLMPEHWSVFMSASELAWLALRPLAKRSDLAHGLWSAKESVMKALIQPLDSQNIEVRVHNDGRAFVAECRVHQTGSTAETVYVSGSLTFVKGWVLALATLPSPLQSNL